MGFAGTRSVVDAELEGRTWFSTWRKVPSQVTPVGVWFDLSMSPGSPVPQYYAAAPFVAAAMSYGDEQGLMVGRSVAPATKHVRRATAMASSQVPLPMPMILCDYLLYYPFIDEGSTDVQLTDNTVTLPRYVSGAGVEIMAVSVAGRTGGQYFQVGYTNSAGVSGRMTPPVRQNAVSVNGSIVTSDRATAGSSGPFLPLQPGDNGVRTIDSVQMLGADVGLFSLVLVQPLAQLQIREQTAPVEVDYLQHFGQLPRVEDDAYLNFVCCPSNSLSGVSLLGDITVAWN